MYEIVASRNSRIRDSRLKSSRLSSEPKSEKNPENLILAEERPQ